jgi:ammonia channel protein AmtB
MTGSLQLSPITADRWTRSGSRLKAVAVTIVWSAVVSFIAYKLR